MNKEEALVLGNQCQKEGTVRATMVSCAGKFCEQQILGVYLKMFHNEQVSTTEQHVFEGVQEINDQYLSNQFKKRQEWKRYLDGEFKNIRGDTRLDVRIGDLDAIVVHPR